jgi:signal transduction histidine kinase/ActR/RegA family two-component response regulator
VSTQRLLQVLGNIAERSTRAQRASELAPAASARKALVLYRDVDLDVLLPMPETPPLEGVGLRSRLDALCREPGVRSARLTMSASELDLEICVADDGTALVLFDPQERALFAKSAEVRVVLGLLGALFREEQRSAGTEATAVLSRATAAGAQALTEALARSREELRGAFVETARLNELLEAEAERKDRFLAMLTHELRNPLWAITASLNAMRPRTGTGETTGVIDRRVGSALRNAEQLGRLLDDLLDTARITQDKVELRQAQVDICELTLHLGSVFHDQARAKGLTLSMSVPEHPVWVMGDSVRLEQILTNLLANAVKYTDSGGDVRLEAHLRDGRVHLVVRDNGIGIASHQIQRVFDLFVQADEARERSRGGLGIGLTLVRRLVELHDGEVTATSEGPGRGTEMRVTLPVIEVEREPQPTFSKLSPLPTSLAKAARRVLVVDDNRDSADTLCDLVRSWGYVARAAYEGTSALREAESFRPDVAILDLGLPDISGYVLANRLRHGPIPLGVLIAVTGYGNDADKNRALAAGFDHHIVKPADLAQLRRLLVPADDLDDAVREVSA